MAFPLLGLGGAARATMPLWRLLGRGRFNPFRAEIPRVPGGLAGQRAGSPRGSLILLPTRGDSLAQQQEWGQEFLG